MPASLDGYLMPEFGVGSAVMKAGDGALGQPATVLRFKFADGSPFPQTISVNGVPMTASEWKLFVDPKNAELHLWVLLP